MERQAVFRGTVQTTAEDSINGVGDGFMALEGRSRARRLIWSIDFMHDQLVDGR